MIMDQSARYDASGSVGVRKEALGLHAPLDLPNEQPPYLNQSHFMLLN